MKRCVHVGTVVSIGLAVFVISLVILANGLDWYYPSPKAALWYAFGLIGVWVMGDRHAAD